MQSAPGRSAAPRAYKRRSARVQLKIQLTIALGDKDTVAAETVTVSKYGARIRLSGARRSLALGECLQVALSRGKDSQTARVVWLDKRFFAHYGIELNDPANFWGVHFPSADVEWHFEGPRRAAAADPLREEASQVPATHPATKLPEPELAATHTTVIDTATATAQPVIARLPVSITGFSSVRQPFTEHLEMAFTSPQEGTLLLQHLVHPGTTLRVTRADDKRVTTARVLGIGRRREAGKWRVRMKCATAFA